LHAHCRRQRYTAISKDWTLSASARPARTGPSEAGPPYPSASAAQSASTAFT
jgi:hypothetical protein